MMLSILVLGANGQLGRSIRALSIDHPFTFAFADIRELDLTSSIEEIERYVLHAFSASQPIDTPCLIVNCAAYTQVDRAEAESEQAYALNAEVVGKLAKIAERTPRIGLIHVSTDYVFDGTAHRPYREEDRPNPLSVYGQTKYEGERMLAPLAALGRALVVRPAWLYSPYGANFVRTMLRLSTTSDSIRVVSDQIGSPTYAPHLAATLLRIAYYYGMEGRFRTDLLHITDEGVASWYDLAAYAIRLSGVEACRIVPITTEDYPTPAQRPSYGVLSKQRLASLYGIYPPHWMLGVQHFLMDRDLSDS